MNIRKYIKQLIIETFYVDPQGRAMTGKEMSKKDSDFYERNYYGEGVPPDEEGVQVNYGFNPKLIKKAISQIQDLPDNFAKNISSLIFDISIKDLTGDVQKDKEMIESSTLSDRSNMNAGITFLGSLGLDEAEKYIIDLLSLDSEEDRKERIEKGLKLSKEFETLRDNQKIVFTDKFDPNNPFEVFFRKTENVGMGWTLISTILDYIEDSLYTIKNETPLEYTNRVFPFIENYVNIAFERMPHIKASKIENKENLNLVKDMYLDSIRFVLTELIGEINFEMVYDSSNKDLPFYPEKSVYDCHMDEIYSNQPIIDWQGNTLHMHDALITNLRKVGVSEQYYSARDCPEYYQTKFTFNKNYNFDPSVNIKYIPARRISNNLAFSSYWGGDYISLMNLASNEQLNSLYGLDGLFRNS